jgi:hypothetical protein
LGFLLLSTPLELALKLDSKVLSSRKERSSPNVLSNSRRQSMEYIAFEDLSHHGATLMGNTRILMILLSESSAVKEDVFVPRSFAM